MAQSSPIRETIGVNAEHTPKSPDRPQGAKLRILQSRPLSFGSAVEETARHTTRRQEHGSVAYPKYSFGSAFLVVFVERFCLNQTNALGSLSRQCVDLASVETLGS